jgi:hypothetical protein
MASRIGRGLHRWQSAGSRPRHGASRFPARPCLRRRQPAARTCTRNRGCGSGKRDRRARRRGNRPNPGRQYNESPAAVSAIALLRAPALVAVPASPATILSNFAYTGTDPPQHSFTLRFDRCYDENPPACPYCIQESAACLQLKYLLVRPFPQTALHSVTDCERYEGGSIRYK